MFRNSKTLLSLFRRDRIRGLHTKVQNLAQTGEGLKDGEIIEWFVKPGDLVNEYDKLCRVQSDKATIDITSAYNGIVHTLSGKVGDIISVGQPLVHIECKKEQQRQLLDKVLLKGYQRAMAKSMSMSASIPHCYAFDIVRSSQKINTAQAVHVLAKAVSQTPIMNAILGDDHSYTIPEGVHINIAINTPHGLVVPCIHDAQCKSLQVIEEEIQNFKHLAMERRLSPKHLEGGSITLSNIGSIGIMSGLGVIQPRQAAIVTIGKMVKDHDGMHAMHVSVSGDHRIIDGYTLATFLKNFSHCLS
jgi:pyruvate/2-oxoglutarate dehydrogenase complex dihydrolipoamide acyltransferase (E2) component